MNPLDWGAGPFLTFYVVAAVAVLLLLSWWRDNFGKVMPGGAAAGLDLFQAAYLAGGRQRVADTVLVGLFEAGAARLAEHRVAVAVDHAAVVAPEFRPLLAALPEQTQRKAVGHRLAAEIDRVDAVLARRGLAATKAAAARFLGGALVLLGSVFALGVVKVVVGNQRGHPVGILVGLMVAVGLIGAVMLLHQPCRTRAGTAALRRLRGTAARAARAPLDAELPLAFALTGTTVLAGRSYGFWFAAKNGGGADGGSDGGGTGGSGCGGCSV